MLLVERGINVTSGIVTFLSPKEFTFGGDDEADRLPTVLKSVITADIFFFTENRDLKVVITANHIVF